MDYRQAVAEGRTLLARSEADQWELARLTYRILVEEKKASIVKWAADLGCSRTHAQNLRNVWERYGRHHDDGRTTRSFNEYYTMAGVTPERADRLARAAKEAGVGVGTAHRTGRDRDRMRERMEDARDLLRDGKRAREILRDPRARRTVERVVRPRERAADAEVPPPPDARPGRRSFGADLSRYGDAVFELLRDMLDAKVSKDDRRDVRHAIEELRVALDWMESHAATGDRSFEDALDAVLAGGEVPPAAVPPSGKKKVRRLHPPAKPVATEEPPVAEPEPEPPAEVPPPAERGRRRRVVEHVPPAGGTGRRRRRVS